MYDVTHRESYKVASDWIKAINMVSRQNDNAGFYRAISIENSGLIIIIAVSGHCPIGIEALTLASSSTLKFPR